MRLAFSRARSQTSPYGAPGLARLIQKPMQIFSLLVLAALPLMLVNGKTAATGRYPERSELAKLFQLKAPKTVSSRKSGCCCSGEC